MASSGNFSDIASAAGAFAQTDSAANALEAGGQDIFDRSNQLAQSVTANSQFKPFTVTSSLGGVTTDPTGGFNVNLSADQQAMQTGLFEGAKGLLGSATAPNATREQQIFDRLQMMMQPQQERDRLSLESRQFNQGRGGVRTSMFGGTPEQLAMDKAIQEQQSNNAFTAINQSMAEQAQNATIGGNMFNMGFAPQNQMLGLLGAGTNLADIAGAGQRQGVQAQALLGQSGIEGLTTANAGAAAARQNTIGDILALLGNQRNAAGETTQTGPLDSILSGLLGRLGGGMTGPVGNGNNLPGRS